MFKPNKRTQESQLLLGWADRTAYVRRPASDFRSRKKRFHKVTAHTPSRFGDAARYIESYNQRTSRYDRYGNSGGGCRQQLCT